LSNIARTLAKAELLSHLTNKLICTVQYMYKDKSLSNAAKAS